ncbi:MAG: hypothetical protein U0V74_15915 [Chitinophagales bacterium]
MKAIILAASTAILIAVLGCKTQTSTNVSYAGEPAVVYKTKGDYSMNVPVTMNESKTEIVAYPAPTDVYYKGVLAYPSPLKKGYLLDNRGIGPNTVFLKYTYADYAKLTTAPTLKEMGDAIIDKDPFLEIYNLGERSRYKDEVAEINEIIRKGGLKKFKRVK